MTTKVTGTGTLLVPTGTTTVSSLSQIIFPRGAAVGNGVGTLTLTLTLSPLAGSAVIIPVTTYNTGGGAAATVVSITDTKSGTWTVIGGPQQGPNQTLRTSYLMGQGGTWNGTPITITITASSASNLLQYAIAQEFTTTTPGTWAVDGTGTGVEGSGTSAAFSKLTPSGPNEMWVAGLGITNPESPPTGFTNANPQGAVSLTWNANVSTPQTVTMAVGTNGSFGNFWAGVAVLIYIKPSAPSNLIATPGNVSAVLNWTAPSGAVTSYNIYMGTSSGGETFLTNTANIFTTYTVTDLTNGTEYYFKVTALNGAKESPQSNEANATPVAPTNFGLPDPYATGSSPPNVFPGSFWATALPTNAPAWWAGGILPAGNSATLIANLVAMYTAQYGAPYLDPRTARYVLDAGGSSDPGADQTWTFNPGGRWDSAPQGTRSVLLPSATANVPTGFVTGPQGDCEVAAWDVNGNLSTSFWATTTNPNGSGQIPAQPPSSNTGQVIIAGSGSNYPGFGASNVTALSTSTSACGAPYIAYAITLADYLSGSINHMMAMEIGNPTGIPVVPATTSDGVSEKYIGQGGIPEGTILMLPAGVIEPNWTSVGVSAYNEPMAHMIFVAAKTYGFVVIDSTAGGGVGIIVESNTPWWEYNPTTYLPNKMYNDNSAPYGQIFGTGAGSGGVSAFFPNLVAVEPGALPLPFVSDNNHAITGGALESATSYTLVANQTTLPLGYSCNANDVLVVTATIAAGTTGTTFSAASGTAHQCWDVTQNGTQAPECVCYVIYGVSAGLSSLTIGTLQAVGSVVVTRWSAASGSNPIVGAPAINNTGTGSITSLATPNAAVTVVGQVVIGICHSPLGSFYNQFSYAEGTEIAYAASSMINYGGTTWSGGYINRHILNSNGQMCVWQNCVVPTATGNTAATMKMNGQPQTMSAGSLVLSL